MKDLAIKAWRSIIKRDCKKLPAQRVDTVIASKAFATSTGTVHTKKQNKTMGLTAQIEKLYSQVRVNSYSATPEFITYLTQYMASLIEVKIRMREWKLQAGAAQLGLVYEKPSCARSRNALPTPSKYSQTSAIIVTSKCQVLDSGTFDQHY